MIRVGMMIQTEAPDEFDLYRVLGLNATGGPVRDRVDPDLVTRSPPHQLTECSWRNLKTGFYQLTDGDRDLAWFAVLNEHNRQHIEKVPRAALELHLGNLTVDSVSVLVHDFIGGVQGHE